jgi:hypothetical protein
MRTALVLTAAVVTGFLTLTMPGASAAPSGGLLSKSTQDDVTKVYYRWHGQHWHHRSIHHGHWRYWN